ncbi:MAG: DinB family protein [Anaerolineae bacterium]|nr:DinB family protein [Anaerolineae bacterium]
MDPREKLIQRLDAARETMRQVVARVDPEREIYPGWTIKHVLAHIAGWDDAAIDALRAHATGSAPSVDAAHGIDAYNAKTVETRESLSYERVVDEWTATRETFKTLLREMPDEKLAQSFVFPWKSGGTAADIVAIFAHHEESHAREIERMIGNPARATL